MTQRENPPLSPGAIDNRDNDPKTHNLHPIVKFVLLFLLVLLVVGIIFSQLITRYHEHIVWLTESTAAVCGVTLSLFSDNVSYEGSYVTFKGFPAEIIDECTGLFEMLILIAAVIAFPTSFRNKMIGVAVGVPAIFGFNVVRIIFLLLAGAYWRSLFDFMHLFFWQGTLIIMISTVWVGWLYLVVYREKRSLAVSD